MYPYVDLGRMLEQPKCAIHISSVEEANTVIYNAKKQFPDRVRSWSVARDGYWGRYKDQTAYTLFDCDCEEPSSMTFASVPFFTKYGYEILELYELENCCDIEESELPVESLIGGTL